MSLSKALLVPFWRQPLVRERGGDSNREREGRERESVSDRERGRRMRERRGGGSQLSLPKCAFIPDPKQFEDDVIKVV